MMAFDRADKIMTGGSQHSTLERRSLHFNAFEITF